VSRPFLYLPEDPSNPYRLGRRQIPDAFPADKDARRVSAFFARLKTVTHTEHVPVFDQGQLGSCTANAALGTMACDPFFEPGLAADLNEDWAVKLYEAETKLDDSQIPGQYPPDDTGSTGAWSMQALEQWGWIDNYVHTRNTHVALGLLNKGPISIGVHWFQSMFTPDAQNNIKVDPASGLAGGHQVCIVGNDIKRQAILVRNSWGTAWGDQGHAWLSWTSLDYLLDIGGDVVQPIMNGVNG
jgi:C1A family cysteine protease